MAMADRLISIRNGMSMRVMNSVRSRSTLELLASSRSTIHGAAKIPAAISSRFTAISTPLNACASSRRPCGSRVLYTGMNEFTSAPSASSSRSRFGTFTATVNASVRAGAKVLMICCRTMPLRREPSVPSMTMIVFARRDFFGLAGGGASGGPASSKVMFSSGGAGGWPSGDLLTGPL